MPMMSWLELGEMKEKKQTIENRIEIIRLRHEIEWLEKVLKAMEAEEEERRK